MALAKYAEEIQEMIDERMEMRNYELMYKTVVQTDKNRENASKTQRNGVMFSINSVK